MSLTTFSKQKMLSLKLENRLFSTLFMVSVFVLSACTIESTNLKDDPFNGRDSSNARQLKLSQNVDIDDLREMAKQQDGGQSVQTSGIKTIDGKFMDANTKTRLFEQRIRKDDNRFNRLETAVQDIRDDFDGIAPAINRLISIESDIKELHEQLSLLVNNEGLGGNDDPNDFIASTTSPVTINDNDIEDIPASTTEITPPPAPQAVKQPAVKKQAPAPTKTNLGSPNINIADHADKTRIVFETPSKQNFNANFDTDNQMITIETNANFDTVNLTKLKNNSKYIADVSQDLQDGNNQTLAVFTKNISRISKGDYIGPSSTKNYHRYYIDLYN